MALPTTYTTSYSSLPEFFKRIRDAQAPDKFTQQQLKDLGFKGSNQRAFLPLLKSLKFLTADGAPTQRYHDYRNHAMSKKVMGDALKEAYSDLFLIKEHPTAADKALIEGKFKSYHNTSDIVAGLMTKIFYVLLDLADLNGSSTTAPVASPANDEPKDPDKAPYSGERGKIPVGLHYNIQIHLPATKDLEVYNAIFKSLKEHFIE